MTEKLLQSHKKEDIYKVFDEISPTYDLANIVLSFGLDRYWRKKLASFFTQHKNYSLLDLATGTGDQIFSILKKNPFASKITGIDLSQKMLKLAEQKHVKNFRFIPIDFKVSDALNLPCEKASIDFVTISFGIRNIIPIEACFAEIHRVLKPNGKAYILEFSIPKNPWIRKMHLFYLRKILPKIGGFISKKESAYHYLNQTIETFPYGEALKDILLKAGFKTVNLYPLSLGIVTIYEVSK